MITKIKTALLGENSRTNGRSQISDIDPFRPSSDLEEDRDYDLVEMDQVFGILRNQRRRYILKYLSLTEGSVTAHDLVEQIAAWERGKETAQITPKTRTHVYVDLCQCHLPKMADASAISYDKRRDVIRKGEQFDSFSHYLRRDE